MDMPKALRGILTRMAGKNQKIEISEELTNAYFGNPEAWQITPSNHIPQFETTNKEP